MHNKIIASNLTAEISKETPTRKIYLEYSFMRCPIIKPYMIIIPEDIIKPKKNINISLKIKPATTPDMQDEVISAERQAENHEIYYTYKFIDLNKVDISQFNANKFLKELFHLDIAEEVIHELLSAPINPYKKGRNIISIFGHNPLTYKAIIEITSKINTTTHLHPEVNSLMHILYPIYDKMLIGCAG